MKKVTFAVNEEDVEYIKEVRVYNVKIPIDICLAEVMNYCPWCGEKLKQQIDPITKKKSKYLLGCSCEGGKNYLISKG